MALSHASKTAKFLAQFVLCFVAAQGVSVYSQSTTRLLLASGVGVPEHAGFAFSDFSGLAMNEAKEVVFLSTLRSARIDLRAVVRSTGVTFSVLAFQGLRSPAHKATYESFSAPSMNAAGVVAFTAQLKDDHPLSAVMRIDGKSAMAVATSGDSVPGIPDATFLEFSAPLVSSAGNVLFGARRGGKKAGSGLFLWSPGGIESLTLPGELKLTPDDLLEPVYFSHDEAVFILRGTSPELATDQFFRAVAIKSFQDSTPQPALSEVFEVLPARATDAPVKMLLILMEGHSAQTAVLTGSPSQPVLAKRPAGTNPKPLGRVLGQTADARGNVIFAASSAEGVKDVGIYCYSNGQVTRWTSPEEMLPLVEKSPQGPIISLAGDSQHTLAFIVPGAQGENSAAIYVTSVP